MYERSGVKRIAVVDAMLALLNGGAGVPAAATVRNVTKSGHVFDNYLRMAPLDEQDAGARLLVGVLSDAAAAPQKMSN